VHPLKPAKSWSIKVEGRDGDSVFVGSSLVIEKLGYLEDPTQWVVPVETRNIQFDGVAGLWWWGQCGLGGELIQVVAQDVDFAG